MKGIVFPEAPETIEALARARNRAAALGTACGGLGLLPYEWEPFIEAGALARLLDIPIEDKGKVAACSELDRAEKG
jgi:hypothetical protein